jgi:4-oxalocrotonate tautomerase
MARTLDAAAAAPEHTRQVSDKGADMPLIHVKLIENVFSPDEKRQIIERLTDTMVEIEGEGMRGVTWVTLEEVSSGDWGMGGNPVTTADVKAIRAGVPA